MGALPLSLLALGIAISAYVALCGAVLLAIGAPAALPRWAPSASLVLGVAAYLACAVLVAREIGS